MFSHHTLVQFLTMKSQDTNDIKKLAYLTLARIKIQKPTFYTDLVSTVWWLSAGVRIGECAHSIRWLEYKMPHCIFFICWASIQIISWRLIIMSDPWLVISGDFVQPSKMTQPPPVETIYKKPNNFNVPCIDYHASFVTLIEHENFGIHRLHYNFTMVIFKILPFNLRVGLCSH